MFTMGLDRRLQLHEVLAAIPGVMKAYFQPPPSLSMTYPCIVYVRDSASTQHANNLPYRHMKRYQVTVIDRDPDSEIPEEVAKLPTSIFFATFHGG